MEYLMFDRCLKNNPSTIPLSAAEERELLALCKKGDQNARRRLIESNIRFVMKVAMKFRNQGMSLADLVQEGMLGLIEALEKFDPAKDCRLITYASWWIRLYIQRSLEQKTRPVNLPINKLDMLRKFKAYEKNFEMQYGRKPYNDELSDEFDMDGRKVDELNDISPSFNSLTSGDPDQPGLEKVLVDERNPDARDVIWLKEARNRLNQAMGVLNPREREVISHRFGLWDGGKKQSLRKVGQRMGMSAEGVRRIEEQAMTKLRRPAIRCKMENLIAC